jgi:hypothetical protein
MRIIGYDLILGKPRLDLPISWWVLRYSRLGVKQTFIDRSEISNFQDLCRSVMNTKIDDNETLKVALDRFNYAYERDRIADKIIDYAISFEALFSKTGEKDSLVHKLATRSARLLKQNFDERKEVFRKIKKFYAIRSKFVHGAGDTRKNDYADLEYVEGYLRTSIRIYLSRRNENSPNFKFDHDHLIDKLDLL